MRLIPLLLLAACSSPVAGSMPHAAHGPEASPAQDPRDAYDVLAYRLDLRVDPAQERLSGTVACEVRVLEDELDTLVLDLQQDLEVEQVALLSGPLEARGSLAGRTLRHEHAGDFLRCQLPESALPGQTVILAVTYAGHPRAKDDFSGFHWAESPSGEPWINTSCQGLGAHSWWPCKASFYNPYDKHERLFVNLTVPDGLYGVSNGRLTGRSSPEDGWETFHWRHAYPCETYSVTINVGPYVVVEQELELEGIEGGVPFIYYVLPENEEKARLQFEQVPELLDIYSRAFGPYPFPESKFALVETNFWGMEHSTAVAYGSSYPAWCEANNKPDRYARRNRFFDYILIHEVAHEWWGNAVSAADWGHFWIHEGFGTYAEGVYVEHTRDRAEADRYFAGLGRRIGADSRLYRGEDPDSREAYSGVIYSKGAWVLNTLRHYLDDDEVWWKSLADFNLKFRYGNARTEDFQAILEENSRRPWKDFFEAWFYGSGFPNLKGEVTAKGRTIRVEIENESSSKTAFQVPLDLRWSEDGEPRSARLMLEPGRNRQVIECGARPENLEVVHLNRLLGQHDVTCKP